MKVMNYHGVAWDMIVKIESWSGNDNFSRASIDNFKIILGMELLCETKMVPTSYLRIIDILDEKASYMVPA